MGNIFDHHNSFPLSSHIRFTLINVLFSFNILLIILHPSAPILLPIHSCFLSNIFPLSYILFFFKFTTQIQYSQCTVTSQYLIYNSYFFISNVLTYLLYCHNTLFFKYSFLHFLHFHHHSNSM